MRSLLFVPGDSEKKLEKGFAAGADVVIVDFEDSVAPQNKPLARRLAPDVIRAAARGGGSLVYVRINDLATGLDRRRSRRRGAGAPGRHHAAEIARRRGRPASRRRNCASPRSRTACRTAG